MCGQRAWLAPEDEARADTGPAQLPHPLTLAMPRTAGFTSRDPSPPNWARRSSWPGCWGRGRGCLCSGPEPYHELGVAVLEGAPESRCPPLAVHHATLHSVLDLRMESRGSQRPATPPAPGRRDSESSRQDLGEGVGLSRATRTRATAGVGGGRSHGHRLSVCQSGTQVWSSFNSSRPGPGLCSDL